MNFNHTEERRMIGDALGSWLRNEYDLDARQRAMDEKAGFSHKAWRELGELGIIGALVSDTHGGFGGQGYDIALVFEELGRALSVEPWLASGLMASRILGECGDPGGLLSDVLSGETVVALAHGEPGSGYDPRWVETTATADGAGFRLNGSKAVALNADTATRLIVSARTSGAVDDAHGVTLFVVDAASPGVKVRGYATIDGLRAAEVELTDVSVEASALIGEKDGGLGAVENALAAATLAVCSESIGIMEVALEVTVEYLKTREQFGKPIGSFQALQHRMVDVATAIEQSRSLVIKAASVFEEEASTRDAALSAAKHYIGVAGRLVGEEAIQMHGGIGMAKATPINHYVKRLIMIDHLFGDTDYHLERYAALSR